VAPCGPGQAASPATAPAGTVPADQPKKVERKAIPAGGTAPSHEPGKAKPPTTAAAAPAKPVGGR